jgi:Flp pilus assembly protein TadD
MGEAVSVHRRIAGASRVLLNAYYDLANAMYAAGEFSQAIGCDERAVVLRPAYAEARSNSGVALQAPGDIGGADMRPPPMIPHRVVRPFR